MYDDAPELERLDRLMRSGLQAQASEVQPRTDLAASAREGARQRRRTRLGVAAAAGALVAIPGVILAMDGTVDPAAVDPAAVDPAGRTVAADSRPSVTAESPDEWIPPDTEREIPDGWRVESYRDVQLRIPPSWGWGASPIFDQGEGSSGKYICRSDSTSYPTNDGGNFSEGRHDGPYVGRPVILADVCVAGQDETRPHVWFDSPLPEGVETLDDGLQRVTVLAGGMRVSVADTDFGELGLILESLAVGEVDDNGCAAAAAKLEGEQPGAADVLNLAAAAGSDDFGGMAVCVYQYVSNPRADPELLYSTAIDGAAERLFLQRLDESPPHTRGCDIGESQTVVLQPQIAASTPHIRVRLAACDSGYFSAGQQQALTVENVQPWAVDGIATYVSGGGQLTGPIASLFAFSPES